MLHGWGGSSIPKEQRTSSEDTVGRLGLGSPSTFCQFLWHKGPLPLQSKLGSGYGEMFFSSILWGLRALSPPSYTQLLGTAVGVDADLALEPPVPLSVWHQEVCATVCPFPQHPLGKEGVIVARKAMLVHVGVRRPAGISNIKLSPHMMLIPTDSFTEFNLS